MPNEMSALAIRPPDTLSERAFSALHEALSQSARGRAFLAEYTRRNRQADTEVLLTAIGRLEARLQADASAAQRLRKDLRMLVSAIRLARPEIDSGEPPARAAKLGKLLDLLEQRIDAMAGATTAMPTAETPGERAMADETARASLVVLPVRKHEPRQTPSPIQGQRVSQPATFPDPLAAIKALSEDERLALFT